MPNVLDSDIVESEFEPESCYYVQFMIKALGKSTKSLIPSAIG